VGVILTGAAFQAKGRISTTTGNPCDRSKIRQMRPGMRKDAAAWDKSGGKEIASRLAWLRKWKNMILYPQTASLSYETLHSTIL
jgi:hypothetical protein